MSSFVVALLGCGIVGGVLGVAYLLSHILRFCREEAEALQRDDRLAQAGGVTARRALLRMTVRQAWHLACWASFLRLVICLFEAATHG